MSMNKIIITMISIIVIISAIFMAFAIIDTKQQKNENKEVEISEEEIYDECTDEYEAMKQNTINVNADEEKTSPNCFLKIKTYFKGCDHTNIEQLNLPEQFVNLSKDEIQKEYSDYEVQDFSNNEVVLYQEREGSCGEHYLVKDSEGVITIFKILEDGSLEEYEKTQITTEYLPETDKINMETGIKVNGKQDLNRLLEDFE